MRLLRPTSERDHCLPNKFLHSPPHRCLYLKSPLRQATKFEKQTKTAHGGTSIPHLALGAVHRDGAIAWDIRQTGRKDVLALAVHSWAPPKRTDLKLVELRESEKTRNRTGTSVSVTGKKEQRKHAIVSILRGNETWRLHRRDATP